MSADFQMRTIKVMDSAVHSFASKAPQPKLIPFKDSFVFRHIERLPQQAIVQKLSRIPSGLRAASLLCDAGLFQEQAAIQRMVDEIGEDVFFLSIPLIKDQSTDHHKRYLEIFFQEEFDSITGMPSDGGKSMLPRKNIRAYIANSCDTDPSGHIKASRTVHQTDSGYVHAASPHIMDSFGGQPPRFHTEGMLGTAREAEYRWYLKNYFFRAVTAFAISAIAFRASGMHKQMMNLMHEWERHLKNHAL